MYYMRVCLVTATNERYSLHFIHPYDLEDIDVEERNDRQNKAVWYPIVAEDMTGMKRYWCSHVLVEIDFLFSSFPNLRIVKKRADDLVRHGNLYDLDRKNMPTMRLQFAQKMSFRDSCDFSVNFTQRYYSSV